MTARDTAPATAAAKAPVTDPSASDADADVTADTDGAADVTPEADAAADAGTTDDTAAAGSTRRRGRRRRHAADDRTDAVDATGDDAAADAPARRAPSRRTRWVVTALLLVSVLFAGAMVTLYVVNRPEPVAGLSSSQQAALDAATQAAINLQTFRRASFDQDFANALASLTPDFAQQQLAPRKDALKTQLTQGGRDASATALSAGLVSSTSTEAVVLVVTNTTQTADDGTSTPFVFSRLQLTLELQNGTWLVSDLKSVGLS